MAQIRRRISRNILPGFLLGSMATIWLVSVIFPSEFFGQEANPTQVTNYRIGTNDLLEIKVFELPELNQPVRVAEDGSISLILVGKIDGVAGLTAQELEKKLTSILDQKYTKAAHVTVFIKEYQKVSVLGAIAKPGSYELAGRTTLLQVISQAGGVTSEAASELYVYRNEKDGQKIKFTVNVAALMGGGDQSLNVELQSNDVVYIPADRLITVYVYGQVKNPGLIQFKQSQKCTLLQAIAQTGGPTEWAKKSRVVIKRKSQGQSPELQIPVNLKDIIAGRISDIVLVEGDVIIVP